MLFCWKNVSFRPFQMLEKTQMHVTVDVGHNAGPRFKKSDQISPGYPF
jgi:hypothetical protein